jgi:multiple antibiotic resistance protein
MTEILNTLKDFHLAFLPLFVVMDPLGNLPFFLAITAPMEPSRRQKVARVALSTGVVIGLVFLALGRGIFAVLGIEVEDFLIAGGVVLLVLAMRDLVASHPEEPEVADEMVAVVPIGTPMLVGPATSINTAGVDGAI